MQVKHKLKLRGHMTEGAGVKTDKLTKRERDRHKYTREGGKTDGKQAKPIITSRRQGNTQRQEVESQT